MWNRFLLAGGYKYLFPLFSGFNPWISRVPQITRSIYFPQCAFPHPRVLGFIIGLFLTHHTTAMIAFCRWFSPFRFLSRRKNLIWVCWNQSQQNWSARWSCYGCSPHYRLRPICDDLVSDIFIFRTWASFMTLPMCLTARRRAAWNEIKSIKAEPLTFFIANGGFR